MLRYTHFACLRCSIIHRIWFHTLILYLRGNQCWSGEDPLFMVQIHCLWWRSTVYGADPLFMAQIHCLWWKSNVCGEDPLFMVKNHCLWWKSTVYGADPLFTAKIHCLRWKSTVYGEDPLFMVKIHCLCEGVILIVSVDWVVYESVNKSSVRTFTTTGSWNETS
jgi:hypothetical protein